MALQPLGTVAPDEAAVTALVQSYHWYVIVGVGYPVAEALATRLLPSEIVPVYVGTAVNVGAVSVAPISADAAAMAMAFGVAALDAVTITVTYFATSVEPSV
jgi:hypothetical protein